MKKASTVYKGWLDRALYLAYGDVSEVTEAFLQELMKELLLGNEVYLRGFGTFKVSVRKGKRGATATLTHGNGKKGGRTGTSVVSVEKKYYVTFKRARAFREMFQAKFGKKEKSHGKVRSRRSGR